MKIRRKVSIILGMMLSFIIVFASIPALRVKANDSIIDKRSYTVSFQLNGSFMYVLSCVFISRAFRQFSFN